MTQLPALSPSVSRSARRLLAAVVFVLALLVPAQAAMAALEVAPVTRNGTVVGSAKAYIGVANGYGILDPQLRNFTPPVNGLRYVVFVQLRATCNGVTGRWNSAPRGATFIGTTTFRANGLVKECSTMGSTVEVYLFVKRAITGEIVGRSRLLSAG